MSIRLPAISTPSNPPGPLAITLGALSPGFHASTERPPNCTTMKRLPTESNVIPLGRPSVRSEEHTSELQSHSDIVCRLLLEKKKNTKYSQQRTGVQRII